MTIATIFIALGILAILYALLDKILRTKFGNTKDELLNNLLDDVKRDGNRIKLMAIGATLSLLGIILLFISVFSKLAPLG